MAACGDANDSGPGDDAVQAISCEYPADGNPAKAVDPPSTTDVKNAGAASATIHLTAGDIEIALDRATTPCTVNSFESLAQQGYFDDTACHRLVDQGIFVLQCGDPSGTGMGGPGYSFADETNASMKYPAGTVAMANAGPDTNGSQFFLVYADTDLPPQYTVFGTMDQAGIDVVGGIAAQGVAAEDQTSPIAEALITSVTLG
ncbi:peptidylprolyl isomerase [Tessaracoccus antarcticus]|uniref:Peptidyl-prolyl cis-trans isomerase n=2 Tax=Tessaracoccus antarcticus TaxID=2479848 RepID=A0A3M0G243_9ACTN|nr:peptidylprolyl isomerase [Tessaracoccus antarcticus]